MRIEVKNKLAIGFTFFAGSNEFLLVGYVPHTKRNGEATTLAVWQTQCAVCDADFETRCPELQMPEAKRCSKHKKPGQKVRAPSAMPSRPSGGDWLEGGEV